MMTLRKAQERGYTNLGWLRSYHTFSFGEYYDANNMGFRKLRVINDDWVATGDGFGTHPHRDMEIITYVIHGGLKHKDSMGNGSNILAGDVQVMSAGTGVQHSEFNYSMSEAVRLLQIWIEPNQKNLPPTYQQKKFTNENKTNKWCLIVSKDSRDGSLKINQDADIYSSLLTAGTPLEFILNPNRHAWIQVARGTLQLNNLTLKEGDAASVSNEQRLSFSTPQSAEILLFDLA